MIKSIGFEKRIRNLIRRWPEDRRLGIIRWYIRHRNLYTNGTNILSNLRVVSFEKIALAMACIKIIFPDVSPYVVMILGCIYYPLLMLFNWFIGYIWEVSDGYTEEAAWNMNRATPNRVFIMNQEGIDGVVISGRND